MRVEGRSWGSQEGRDTLGGPSRVGFSVEGRRGPGNVKVRSGDGWRCGAPGAVGRVQVRLRPSGLHLRVSKAELGRLPLGGDPGRSGDVQGSRFAHTPQIPDGQLGRGRLPGVLCAERVWRGGGRARVRHTCPANRSGQRQQQQQQSHFRLPTRTRASGGTPFPGGIFYFGRSPSPEGPGPLPEDLEDGHGRGLLGKAEPCLGFLVRALDTCSLILSS